MSRRALALLLSCLLAAGLSAGTLVARVPYVALGPGPTFNTLGEEDGKPVIDISGREVFPADGHLDLTTVGVRTQLTLAQALVGWVRRDEAVVPRELVFPPGRTEAQVDAENSRQMVASQDAAITAALTRLGVGVAVDVATVAEGSPAAGVLREGDTLVSVDGVRVTSPDQLRTLVADRAVGASARVGYERDGRIGEALVTTAPAPEAPSRPYVGVGTTVTYPFTITIALDEVGGPSAGLMFALGIMDKLEPGPLTGGEYVAGTGEITPEGVVRPIGGIQQKLRGAREKGATVFLVPAGNCADAAQNRPPGLELARVGDLDDAVAALAAVRNGGAPAGCT